MSSDYGLYESDSYKASRLEQENVELRSRLQAAEEAIERLREAHYKNVWQTVKHQDKAHRCEWRAKFEAVVSRSKAALTPPNEDKDDD